jgi:cobalt-zinc-cadmium efflux system protein
MPRENELSSPAALPHKNHAHSHRHGDHHHGHDHGPADYNRAFALGVVLNVGFVVVEAVFGIVANSLALLADAGHNLSDVLGLLLAWGAMHLSRRRPTRQHTYGLRRSSILAAVLNAVLLLLAVGGILWEALHRLGEPQPVAASSVIWVALVGIVINLATAMMFVSGRKSDMNLRGAFLHMAADAAVSLGVVVAGLVIMLTDWQIVDPLISIAIAVVITVGTWSLLKDSMNLAMDAIPATIDREAVERYLAGLPGVTDIHDLHIWAMSTTEVALTAHLVRPAGHLDDGFLDQAGRDLRDRFKIDHATLQVEAGDPAYPCRLAGHDVV